MKAKSFDFIFNSKFKISVIFLSLSLILFVFQNCGGPSTGFRATDEILPQSPFFEQRVRLVKVSAESKDEDIQKSFNPKEITILMKNKCVKAGCSESPDAGSSLACDIQKNSKIVEGLEESLQAYTWEVDPRSTEDELEMELRSNSIDNDCIVGVSYNLNYEMESAYTTASNDPYATSEYYHELINGPAGYQYFYTDLSQVTVGVIDTGVQNATGESHENLGYIYNQLIDPGATDTDACLTVCHWHGTFVTNIIKGLRNNAKGGYGIAPNAYIYSFQVGDASGGIKTTQLVNALQRARIYNLDIVNMSLGGSSLYDFAFQDGIISLLNAGTMVVVSAGNDSRDLGRAPYYPASFNYDGQVTVGAASPEQILSASSNPPYSDAMKTSPLKRDSYSNYGSGVVHISAPGTRIYSAMLNNTYGVRNGTSFSTPMVTGALALLKGHLRAKGIEASPQMLKSLLLEGSRNVSSLTEGSGINAYNPFQENRFLDIGKLATVTSQFLAGGDSKPGRIELVNSSAAINVSNVKEVTIEVDVRDATAAMGYTLRAYTNSSFLVESYTGFSCSIVTGRQKCYITIPYSKLLIDPHVYLRVTDASGNLISDLTIPKTAINLGVKAEAQLKGEIIGAFHNGETFEIEGWTCLEGFADPIGIEVRLNTPDGSLLKTLVTNRQARGNYFTECNAPEISFGFRYTIPKSWFGWKFYFKAIHAGTGKELNLKALSYQPGYNDAVPASYVDFLMPDRELLNAEIDFNLTKYELNNWNLTIEGSACNKSTYRSPAFAVGVDFNSDPFAFLKNVPSLSQVIPKNANSTRVASVQEAVQITSLSRSYKITNSVTRAVDGRGSISYPSSFSDIQNVRVFDPQTSTNKMEYLTTITDLSESPNGFLTIVPDVELNDGCKHPSGFSKTFNIKNIFKSVSGSSSLAYRADVYTEQQVLQIPEIAGAAPFLKLESSYDIDISAMNFDPNAFNIFLQPSFGKVKTYPTLIYDHFKRYLIVSDFWSKVFNDTVVTETRVITFKNIPSFVKTQITDKQMQIQALDISLASTLSNMTVVYQSPVYPISNKAYKVFPVLTYKEAEKFGFLNEEFKLQMYLQSTGLWYDIDLETVINYKIPLLTGETIQKSKGIITGNGSILQSSTSIQFRVLSNKENKLRLSSIGFYVE